ncbi:MAG: RHS repeat-associated core domain-containing protein, partial [Phormidesmis sp. RL_2_1]|nr:RHS repeat-associated core domain-containing protein [Phormidesmis sp. RL_2_1]
QVTSETNPDVDFRFGYTGRERDEETGLYYYRARYFDPAVGTFVSEDPLGFGAGDVNMYRYVFNSPTNYTDPSGEIVPLVIAAGAALAPLVPIAVGAAFGGGFDLAVQGVQIWQGSRDNVDWGSVGISVAGGALSGGLGSLATSATRTIISQTGGIATRALINGFGSAFIGGYTQVVRNAVNDVCLGNGVRDSAVWGGAFGAAGSVATDVVFQPATTTLSVYQPRTSYYRGREVPYIYTDSTLGSNYPRVTARTNMHTVTNSIATGLGNSVSNISTLFPLFGDRGESK